MSGRAYSATVMRGNVAMIVQQPGRAPCVVELMSSEDALSLSAKLYDAAKQLEAAQRLTWPTINAPASDLVPGKDLR